MGRLWLGACMGFGKRSRATNIVVPELHYETTEHISTEWSIDKLARSSESHYSSCEEPPRSPSRHNIPPLQEKMESRVIMEKHSGLLETMRRRKTSINSVLTIDSHSPSRVESSPLGTPSDIIAKHGELLETLRRRRMSKDLLLGVGATMGGRPCCLDTQDFTKTRSLFVAGVRGLCPDDDHTFLSAATLKNPRSYSEADVRTVPVHNALF
eukprot:Opistho-2@79712